MKYKILIVLFAAALLTSTLLATGRTGSVCNTDEAGCVIVQKSQYAETLGIPNTYLGIAAFAALLLLTALHLRNPNKTLESLIKVGTVIIGLFGAYFIYLQLFIINALCPFCMVIDSISILSPIILFFYNS